MADFKGKDKPSFLLWKNQRHLFDSLPDVEAGKLIKKIFNYVCCDENQNELTNPITNFAFDVIRSTLENDLNKWQEISKKRSDSGKLHKGNQYTKMEQMEQMSQNGTNGTNGTDIDIDIDIVKDIDIKKKENTKVFKKEIDILSADKPKKHLYGRYVTLSDDEVRRLKEEYGDTYIDSVIVAIDEQTQMTGNKNKWKDFNLVIRKAIKNNWACIPQYNPNSIKGSAIEKQMVERGEII